MKTRLERYNISTSLLSNVKLVKEIEDNIYSMLVGRDINLALIVESLGIQRNTAYYRLRKRIFTTEELLRIAQRATEIYKVEIPTK